MMFQCCILLLCFTLTFTTSAYKPPVLPKYFKKCSLKEPKPVFEECFREAFEMGMKSLSQGDSSINVEPLDPHYVAEIKISQTDGPVKLDITQRNVSVNNVTKDIQIYKARFDMDESIFEIKYFAPRVIMLADQEVNGRILVIPINRKGKARIMMDNVKLNYTIKFEQYERHGYHYVRPIEQGRVHMSIEKLSLTYDKLESNDRTFNNVISNVFNDNWKILFQDLKPVYEQTMEKIFHRYFSRFMSKMPIESVFLV